jgi:hypothetical protein
MAGNGHEKNEAEQTDSEKEIGDDEMTERFVERNSVLNKCLNSKLKIKNKGFKKTRIQKFVCLETKDSSKVK